MVLGIIALTFFFFNDTATTEIYTLSLHDALPIFGGASIVRSAAAMCPRPWWRPWISSRPRTSPSAKTPSSGQRSTRSRRSEEHTSELQSLRHLVCRLLLEKKKELTAAPTAAA